MAKELPIVVGTAGHIDHGKTTLVKALTGVDLDSRDEEKRRGITIELGFTPLTLPDGRVISLVDVPGHEKLIRQMVAGASGLDAVMLVVAADEGVMPQTREHLEILSLLGLQRGLVVLTKSDSVDADMLELAKDEVGEILQGTFLEKAPIIPVSAKTGYGLNQLLEKIGELTASVTPRSTEGAYFLPVDRVFPVAGFGTVVTGTSLRGQLTKGDELDLLPLGKECAVRSLQVHGQSVERALAGQRTAVCVTNLQVNQIRRGDVLALRGVFRSTECLDVMLTVSKSQTQPISHWQRVRLHIGTADLLAHVALLGTKKIEPGETQAAQLVLEEPIAAALGQRFILRFYSPLRTIGGGVVVNTYGKKPNNRAARLNKAEKINQQEQGNSPTERLLHILEDLGPQTLSQAVEWLQVPADSLNNVINHLVQKNRILYLKGGAGLLLARSEETRLKKTLLSCLTEFHAIHPHLPGQPIEDSLKDTFSKNQRVLGKRLIDSWVEEGAIKECDGYLALPDFSPHSSEELAAQKEKILTLCDARGFMLPTISELQSDSCLSDEDFSDRLTELKKTGQLVILDGTFVISRGQLEKLISLCADIQGGFALADVKNLTGASRKFTMPMMEHLDRMGITKRAGDKRVVLRREL